MSDRVSISEYQVCSAPASLKAYGLGSCLAISLYDPEVKIGALGHMLLPQQPKGGPVGEKSKYVDAAIRTMLENLLEAGASRERLVAKMAGGANMFESEYLTLMGSIGFRNARSARETLTELEIPLLAEEAGGNRGRTVEFDLNNGDLIVYCARDNRTTRL